MLLWPLLFPFRYLGFDVLVPAIFHGVGGVAAMELGDDGRSDLDRYVDEWRGIVTSLDDRKSVPFNRDADFDERLRLRPDAPSHSPFISHDPADLW